MTTHKSPPAPTLVHDTAKRKRNQPKTMGRRTWGFVRELIIVVIGAVVVSSLLRAFVGQMFIIPSQSMENTLLVGDRVVVEKLTNFHRGDVVVFSDPGGWLEEDPADPGPWDKALEFIGLPTKSTPGHLIKRVIGMPGDKVVCCTAKGRITVNGYPLERDQLSLYRSRRRPGQSVRCQIRSRGTQGPHLRHG